MSSGAVGTALGSRGSSIATYLDAIRIETVKKDQRIRTLEARISTLCANRADADALNDENRELKTEVEQLKREAHTYKAQVESMNSELRGVIRELASTKHDMEQLLNAEPGVEQLHADFVEDGCSDDNNCSNDENGGDDTEGVRDKESDRGDEGIDERTNTKTGEWIPSQPASLAPTRSILQEVCTPSPLKRQKATTEEDEPTISPTSKLLTISENVSVPLISALEKSRPWNAVYAKSPTFSHSFIYASLPKETKKVIDSLLAFKSKFRRELWEQLHWIRFPSWGALVAAASAARASRHRSAKIKWNELQEKLIAQIMKGYLPRHVWSEPFFWIWRTEPVPTPLTCTTELSFAALDKKEPMRCFFVHRIGSHPFYKNRIYFQSYALPDTRSPTENFI